METKEEKENAGSSNNLSAGKLTERGKSAIRKYTGISGESNRTNGESGSSGTESGGSDRGSTDSASGNRKSASGGYTVSRGNDTENNEPGKQFQSTNQPSNGEPRRRGRPPGSRNRNRDSSGNGDGNGEQSSRSTDADKGFINLTFGDVFTPDGEKKKRGRPKKEALNTATVETIADGLEILFQLPPLIGLGQVSETENVWPLSRFESVEWAKSLHKVAGTIDDRRFKLILKTIEKISPWVGVALVTHQIVTPRMKISMELLNNEKRKREESRISENGGGNATSTTSGIFATPNKNDGSSVS